MSTDPQGQGVDIDLDGGANAAGPSAAMQAEEAMNARREAVETAVAGLVDQIDEAESKIDAALKLVTANEQSAEAAVTEAEEAMKASCNQTVHLTAAQKLAESEVLLARETEAAARAGDSGTPKDAPNKAAVHQAAVSAVLDREAAEEAHIKAESATNVAAEIVSAASDEASNAAQAAGQVKAAAIQVQTEAVTAREAVANARTAISAATAAVTAMKAAPTEEALVDEAEQLFQAAKTATEMAAGAAAALTSKAKAIQTDAEAVAESVKTVKAKAAEIEKMAKEARRANAAEAAKRKASGTTAPASTTPPSQPTGGPLSVPPLQTGAGSPGSPAAVPTTSRPDKARRWPWILGIAVVAVLVFWFWWPSSDTPSTPPAPDTSAMKAEIQAEADRKIEQAKREAQEARDQLAQHQKEQAEAQAQADAAKATADFKQSLTLAGELAREYEAKLAEMNGRFAADKLAEIASYSQPEVEYFSAAKVEENLLYFDQFTPATQESLGKRALEAVRVYRERLRRLAEL